MSLCYSIVVSGKVQGVYYRASTRDIALSLGLTGTVKNDRAGTVSIVAVGNKSALESLVKWCEKGPPGAIVESVTVNPENSIPDFTSFEISY